MTRQRKKGRTQPRRFPTSTSSPRIPFPDALNWDFETLWAVTEEFIRTTIVQLGLPEVDSDVPLNLYVLPDCLPGGFKKPNYFLLSLLAIAGSSEKRLKLSEIYEAIDKRYPDLEKKRPAYKRSLRHKLSLEPIFVNVKKTSDERESVSNSDPDTRGNDWVIDIRRINVPKRSRKRRKSVGCGSSSPLPSIPPPLAPAPAPSIGTSSQVANEPHVASTSAQAYSVNEYANGFQPAIYQAQINSGFVPHPVHMMSHNYAGYLQPPSYTQLSTPPQAPINGVVPPPFHITINNNYENCTFFQ